MPPAAMKKDDTADLQSFVQPEHEVREETEDKITKEDDDFEEGDTTSANSDSRKRCSARVSSDDDAIDEDYAVVDNNDQEGATALPTNTHKKRRSSKHSSEAGENGIPASPNNSGMDTGGRQGGVSKTSRRAAGKRSAALSSHEDAFKEALGDSRNVNSVGKPPEAGIVLKIYVENFMCHRKLTVDLCRNVNFIYGQNGSGKVNSCRITNILQLYLTSLSR
jgi:hypothetical protein